MDDPERQLIHYLVANSMAPWRWSDDGDVIVWKDGTTVAFRQEIIPILEALIPHDWPPFEALVTLLAACRGKVMENFIREPVSQWPASEAGDDQDDGKQLMLSAFQDRLQRMQTTVVDGLKSIAHLPAGLRGSLRTKATLAEMVFGKEHSMASIRSADPLAAAEKPRIYHELLTILRSGVLTDEVLNNPLEFVRYNEYSFSALHEGLSKLTLETLQLRIGTGLDEVPQPAPVPIPPATRVRQVLEELQADVEHSGFARLVRDFMAALQLPRRLSEQDEMPIGGFADITNRGNPDRLLLSELAHDDLTLAVRIAVNEALYLRREPPAREPPSTLAILLDAGVRLWGTPRVLATAVSLAFVAKSLPHEQCAVFRAEGAALQPVDLLSKEGVITQLGALQPQAHPGAALAGFRAQLGDDEHAEAVLITHYDVWKDPDFQRDLALAHFEMLYVALVERDGQFTLLRHPRGGAPLCEAQVDIETLFSSRPPALIDRAANPDLPVILSTRPFPFLLAVQGTAQKFVYSHDRASRNHRVTCVMKDRRLLTWKTRSQGARTIATELPHGTTLALNVHDDGSVCVIKTINRRQHLFCRVYSEEGELLHSHDWQFTEFVARIESRSDVLFVICDRHAEVRDLTTGGVLASQKISRGESHGRYFRDQGTWCVLMWEGQALWLEPIVFLGGLQTTDVLRVFNNADAEGPWVITRRGDVHDPTGKRLMQLGPLKPVVRISDDGRRLLVASQTDGQVRVVDLSHGRQWTVTGPLRDEDWMWTPLPPLWNMRRRFRRAALFANTIHLQAPSGLWWWINIQSEPMRLELAPHMPTSHTVREFKPVAVFPQEGFTLKIAEWTDGRRVYLDDRGLLHVKPAYPRQAEFSLVLTESGMAAWSNHGLWWGNPFFIGDQPSMPDGNANAMIYLFSSVPA